MNNKSEAVELNARVEGEGPAILLMHGLFGSGRNWFSVQRQLASNWQVHALDLRNHGAAQWSGTMSYADMSRDVIAYLDSNEIKQAVVLGHSMGGKVAMTMALQHPTRLRALIAVDIAPVEYEPTLRPFLQAMLALDLSAVTGRRDADVRLRHGVPDDGIRGFLLQNLVSRDGGYQWRINLAAIDAGLEALGNLPAGIEAASATPFTKPVLAIYGEQSGYMKAGDQGAMQATFPTTRFVGIPNAGHWVHAEQADAFYAGLNDFLSQL